MIKHKTFMEIAYTVSKESKAVRRKVGALIVKDNNVIAVGYNGTPSGFDNNCEYKKITKADFHSASVDLSEVQARDIDLKTEAIPVTAQYKNVEYELVTKPEVLHAESNAIAKCARSVNSSEGADIYTTTSPCMECSKLIIQAGIKRVFYLDKYKDESGLLILQQAGIEVEQIII
jgi:dCMP deaminase